MTGHVITPPVSPVQVPGPVIASEGNLTTVTAHPYLSRWVHDLIVAPPGTAVEVRGAVRADLSDLGGPILNLFGHCLFDDANGSQTHRSDAVPPVRATTPPLSIVVEPVLHRR
ncbi:hypothetical protein [uncultured Williamsia sp.]|uniref:hypothetical protein n=1 Tax=uncultured Williamsia sp. TaxID=259311 RepID=UPI0026088BB6|nr:hypothetical protein [uncultured Williamsia sp.]